ncbi:7265_t:CDS:1, partial [Funneliformis mosseae]
QKPYKSILKNLREYETQYASKVYSGKKSTSENLKYFMRITLRQESDCLDAGNNYAISNTESENSSPEDDCNLKPESESAENNEI